MARNAETLEKERIVVGISGATGVAYGIRLLEALSELRVDSKPA
jgi:3-polyprenyl-4-hydroxybenzoate decarboxylase